VTDVNDNGAAAPCTRIAQLLRGEIISEAEVQVICEKTKEVLAKEENVVPVAAPVTVVRPRSFVCPIPPL
jgi:hypothetical protein